MDTLFKDAASREERVASVAGGPVVKRSELTCVNCGRAIGGNVAFAPTSGNHDASVADGTQLFCDTCHPVRLGPTCRGCGKPAPRDEAVVALDCHWHRACLRCEEPGCNKQLPDEYYEWKGELRCREHYVQVGADCCAKCGEPVDGGLRALGQVWHDECLTCKVTGETLGEGEFYVHQGNPLSGSALRQTAALCKACGEPALHGRVFAMGNVFHHACFRCACCHSEIGERRFVPYDGEPYLEGCYQKLFGALSGQMQELVQGDTQRYAVHVPLSMQLGPGGLTAFAQKHLELFPQVRRLLRERGVTEAQAFLFTPPAISKPSLCLCLTMPIALDALEALPEMLRQERLCQQWEQLVTGVHDTAASKGNPWWATMVPEMSGGE